MSTGNSREPSSPLATFQLTPSLALRWIVVSTAAFFAFAYGFAAIRSLILGRPPEPVLLSIPADPNAALWAAVLVLVILVSVLHEAVHGICMAYYGEHPSFGLEVSFFVVPYVYTNSGGSYERNQMLVILLAPLISLSVLGVVAMGFSPSPFVTLALAINAAGSVGDLWMAAVLLGFRSSVRIGQPAGSTAKGIGIYGSSGDDLRSRGGPVVAAAALAGAVGTFVLCVAVMLVGVFLSLAFGSGTVVFGDPHGRWFLFRHDVAYGSGLVVLEVGHRLMIALSVLGGLLWAGFGFVRK